MGWAGCVGADGPWDACAAVGNRAVAGLDCQRGG